MTPRIAFITLLAAAAVGSSNPLPAQSASDQIGGCPSDSARFHPCALAKAQTFNPPRTPDGHPDLQGLWDAPTVPGGQSLEEHPGAYGFSPTRSKIVDPPDGKIPYQPWALVERDRRREDINAYECERLYNERFCQAGGPDIALALPHPWRHIESVELAGVTPR